MLAHEPFSDCPRRVCPVLAAFLRAYNDHLAQDQRQLLYPWASDAVHVARAIRCRPDLHGDIDDALRSIYGLRALDLDALRTTTGVHELLLA